MSELSPEILLPAAIALAAVAVAALWGWFRRERALSLREATVRQREAELRAIARRRQREQEAALDEWVEQETTPASVYDTRPLPPHGLGRMTIPLPARTAHAMHANRLH